MTNKTNIDYVKKQTLIGAVVLSFVVGFIGGAGFTAFKLPSNAVEAEHNHETDDKSQAQANKEKFARIASQIFQLEQFLKENPADANSLKTLGDLFYDSDQYANSIEAYHKYLDIIPDNISVITDLGTMYRLNKQPQKAIEMFDKAIGIDPKFEPPRFNKGLVLLHDLGDPEGGIKVWEELVSINPLALAPNGESLDSIIQRMKNRK